jgi:outer membrane protein assembly factor BamB
LSGNDRLVTLSIDASVTDGKIAGSCEALTECWLSARGKPVESTGAITGGIGTWPAKGRAEDALTENACWPSVLGPSANASARDYDGKLVESLSEARLVWVGEDKIASGRTTKFQYLSRCPLNFYPNPGPYSTPIVWQGLVFHYDVIPDLNSVVLPDPPPSDELKRGVSTAIWATKNDHAVIAMDARTGRTVWRVRFPGKGPGGVGGKGGGAGGCCLVEGSGDRPDVLICVGINGFANGLEPRTGQTLWTTQVRLFNGSTAPMPIGGVAVVSLHYGGLAGIDPVTGKQLWKLDRASSRHSCALPWRRGGRDYAISLFSGDAESSARLVCIRPSDGEILWEHADVGGNDVTMTLIGDIVVTNGRAVESTDAARMAREGKKALPTVMAYRLTAAGAQPLWELPAEHVLNTYGYAQPCAAGSVAIPPVNTTPIAVDVSKGTVIHSGISVAGGLTKSGHAGGGIGATTSNGLVFTSGFAVRDAASGAVLDVWRGPFAVGYLIPILSPIVDGRIFIRSQDAMLCYDLREPKNLTKQTLAIDLPAELFGNDSVVNGHVRVRNGRLAHGLLREGEWLCAIDTSRARWDGKTLSGILAVDTGYMLEEFGVNAALEGDTLSGTIGTAVRGFAKPIAVTGAVHLMPRDANWKPGWTHVLRLGQAVRNFEGKPGHMYLALSLDGGRIAGMTGVGSSTGRAPIQVDFSEARIESGRLVGTVRVVFRPDLWVSAWTESETDPRVAASYTLEVDLSGQQHAGTHNGTWGVAWSKELPLRSRLASASRIVTNSNGRMENQ